MFFISSVIACAIFSVTIAITIAVAVTIAIPVAISSKAVAKKVYAPWFYAVKNNTNAREFSFPVKCINHAYKIKWRFIVPRLLAQWALYQ